MNSKQFLKEGFLEDAHEAHVDHEVQMARVDCYYAAEHAIVLHKLLRNISEEQGLEGWVASKITLANDYLKSVREHLEYQMMNADADEGDFLPLAEGISPTKKKVSEDITDGDNSIQEFERGPWYVILRGQPVTENGEPKRFNWLNGAKTYFRSMLDDDPELAREIKREYDEASDKKAVIYYTKKLPTISSSNTQPETGQQVSEAGNKPGLWANIRAKRERIKSGSGERMRKPGSKGAPSNADLKSIRAASNESTELEESLADEFGEFAKKFGQQRGITIKPRDPKPRSPFPGPENKGAELPLDRETLEARLKELQSRFDPAYEYSDDHAFWSEQNEIAKEIRSIKRALSQQGVAEGFSDVVKGVKRSIKGKEHPDVVASKHAGRAIGHYNQGDIAAGDKETERYKKIRNMHLKAKGVAEGSSDDLVYISVDRVEAFEDWMDSEGLETDVPKTDEGTYVVYDYSNADYRSKMYASDWNEKKGVAETKIDNYKDMGATSDTTHFIKNTKTGKVVSPHRSLKDAKDALVAYVRDGKGDDYKIVRARKEGMMEDPVTGALIGGALGIAAGAKGAHHAAKHTDPNSKTPVRDFIGNFAKGIVDPRTYVPKKKTKKGVAETKVDNYKDMGATKDTTHFVKNMTTGKIVSPHRSKQDAEDALVAKRRDSKDEFKIVRARKESMEKDSGNAVEALIQVYNNRDQKIIKTKVFASEAEANRWADRNNAVILKLKDVPKKSTLDETSAGSVATVVNPTPKNRSKVGTLFGGTYKQTKAKK